MRRGFLWRVLLPIALGVYLALRLAQGDAGAQEPRAEYRGVLQETNDAGTFDVAAGDKPVMTIIVPGWVANELRAFKDKAVRITIESARPELQGIAR